MHFAASASRWQAVLARDARADGRFFFAVVTTGVYCRPSCGARRPRPEHVRFFEDGAAAERAGFRPCRRCRPERKAEPPHREAILRACRKLEAADDAAPGLQELARGAGLSVGHFQRVFRRMIGVTPRQYAAGRRATALRRALPNAASVTDALYTAGYGASSRFYAQAARELGMAPSRFRRGGAGETIRVAVMHCGLGQMLIAATERGICGLELGDDPRRMLADFRSRFSRARIAQADRSFAAWAARAVKLAEGVADAALPLDLRGTAFQLRVWRALQDIPSGQTVSYAGVARRLGQPRAARAVARACADNPVALAVPCHRVVRGDGAPGGYRWGEARKRALLDREAAGRAGA